MSLTRYLLRLGRELAAYALSTRRPMLAIAVIGGAIATAVGLAVAAAAPVAIYPFL